MRRVLVLLLILFFAGVQVFPVIGSAQADAGHMEQAVPASHVMTHGGNHGAGHAVDPTMSHFMACCEHMGDTESGEKASGCSADCASIFVEISFLLSADPAPREAVPLPAFAAPKVYLSDHPPKPA